jgi:signal transduction histidine kinase
MARFVKFFIKRFNNIKTPKILEYRPGYIRIKLGYGEKYKPRVTKNLCDWNAGVYTSHGILTGSFNIQIRETHCCARGDDDCVFEITWSYCRFWRRLLIFLHSMLDPDYIMSRDLDNLLLQDSIMRQEGIIADKTAKLEQAHEQLREQEKLMTEIHIAGGMAHEIRNALGAAKLRISKARTSFPLEEGNQHLLELFRQAGGRQDLTQEEKEKLVSHARALKNYLNAFGKTIDEISKAIERGLSVANRVMNYSLLHQETAPQFIDIQSSLENLCETYLESFQELEIEIDLDIEQGGKIQAAADQFHAVFQNLLLNARDAIEEAEKGGGKIVIRSRRQSTNVVIEVIDNGVGMDEEQQDKIFQHFYSTKPAKGMGLGLNECQKILRNLNGRMEVQSIRGEGTTFRIVFQSCD